MALTDTDARDLMLLRSWARTQDNEANISELVRRENALSPAALDAWQNWPSSTLSSELDRWIPRYLVQKTAAGYRAFRWLVKKKNYAMSACAARLSAEQAEAYRAQLIRV